MFNFNSSAQVAQKSADALETQEAKFLLPRLGKNAAKSNIKSNIRSPILTGGANVASLGMLSLIAACDIAANLVGAQINPPFVFTPTPTDGSGNPVAGITPGTSDDEKTASLGVKENLPATSDNQMALGRVAVTGENDVTYAISKHDGYEDYFVIDPDTGELKMIKPLNFEDVIGDDDQITLEVTASYGEVVDTHTVIITVDNDVVDDQDPVFRHTTSATFSVDEGVASTTFGDITAVDPNTGDAHVPAYTIFGSSAGNAFKEDYFAIDSASGQLSLIKALDYDDTRLTAIEGVDGKKELTLTIRATLNEKTDDHVVTVTVNDVDEHNPRFTSDAGNTDLAEEVPGVSGGTVLGTVVAEDMDASDVITYSITGATGYAFTDAVDEGLSDYFSIGTDGKLRLAEGKSFDYEDTAKFGTDNANREIALNIRAISTTETGATKTVDQEFTINVTDVDENVADQAPVFVANTPISVNIDENTGAGTTIATFSATDADNDNSTIVYTFSASNSRHESLAAKLEIDSSSGALKLKSGETFNHEDTSLTNGQFAITVTATSNGKPVTQQVTVTVNDVNEAPAFPDGTLTSFTVAENVANYDLGAIAAVEPDAGQTPVYTITSLTDDSFASKFAITNGQLRLTSTLDFEDTNLDPVSGSDDKKILTLDIKATSAGGSNDHKVTVTVTDVNEDVVDQAPVFDSDAPERFTVAENDGSETFGNITATDPDDGEVPTYTIVGSSANNAFKDYFSINSVSGQLRLTDALNFEDTRLTPNGNNRELTLTIRATSPSRDDKTADHTVTIQVTNVDEAPVFDTSSGKSPTSVNIDENAEGGASGVRSLGQYRATDVDNDDSAIVYTFSASNSRHESLANKLEFDNWGNLRLKDRETFNHEYGTLDNGQFAITVTATSNGESVTQQVTVTVNDVDEAPEFYSNTTASFTVAENDGSETFGNITATDPDEGEVPTYSITSASGYNFDGGYKSYFAISDSGQLTLKKAFDYEQSGFTNKDITLNVRAISPGNSDNYADRTVTVTVTDINERPEFPDNTPARFTVAENVDGATLGPIAAVDPDENDTPVYTITSPTNSSFASKFTITNGQLRLTSALDYENDPLDTSQGNGVKKLVLNIKATSPGGSDNHLVTVTVTDDTRDNAVVDVAPPVFGTFTIREQPPAALRYDDGDTIATILTMYENYTGLQGRPSTLGTITATDDDSDQITYSIISSTGYDFREEDVEDYFEITTDGTLKLKGGKFLDYENAGLRAASNTNGQLSFVIRASSGAVGAKKHDDHTINISVDDIEPEPAFGNFVPVSAFSDFYLGGDDMTTTLSQWEGGTVNNFGKFVVTEGQGITYSIGGARDYNFGSSETVSTYFTIDPSSGLLRAIKGLDYDNAGLKDVNNYTGEGMGNKQLTLTITASSGTGINKGIDTHYVDFRVGKYQAGTAVTDTMYGSFANDILFGEAGTDTLYGYDGNDTLNGGARNDILYGGAGNDEVWGGDDDDILYGGAGNDLLLGGAGNDVLYGGAGDDTLRGDAGADQFWFGKFGTSSSDTNHGIIGYLSDIFSRAQGDTIRIKIEAGTTVPTFSITNILFAELNYNYDSTKITIAGWAHDSITVKGFRHTGADAAAIKAEWAKDIWFHQKQTATTTVNDVTHTLRGGDDQDYLEGNSGNDKLDGYGGNDILYGGAGDDILYGYSGDDYLYGHSGDDRLYGDDGSDTLYGGADSDELWGNDGDDILDGGAGTDSLYGQYGADTLNGGAGNDTLDGGPGADQFWFSKFGTSSSNTNHDTIWDFNRGEGDTIRIEIEAGTTVPTFSIANTVVAYRDTNYNNTKITFSGWAHDSITVMGFRHTGADAAAIKAEWAKDIWFHQKQTATGTGTHTLNGGVNQDYLEGNAGIDRLNGGAGDDKLYGGAGNDRLDGDAGTDRLYGGAGNDTLYGGAGADQFWFRNLGTSSNANHDIINDFDRTQGDMIIIETGITATVYSDAWTVTDNLGSSTNTITVDGWSHDRITGSSSNPVNKNTDVWFYQKQTATGADNYYLYGNNDQDYIEGNIGDDTLHGGNGNDILDGGAGSDHLRGHIGNDILYGGAGDDDVWGEDGDDYLYGEAGDDHLEGYADDDVLYGGAGTDTLDGGAGNDVIYGEAGDDTLYGSAGADQFWLSKLGTSSNTNRNTIEDFSRTQGDMIIIETGEIAASSSAAWTVAKLGPYTNFITVKDWSNNDADNAYDWIAGTSLKPVDKNTDVWFHQKQTETTTVNNVTHTLRGNSDNDYLEGNSGNDDLWGNAGNDYLWGNTGDDRLLGFSGDDTLDGGAGTDSLYGYGGNDILYGGAGDDALIGGADDDKFYGGAGDDTLLGGTGADQFWFGKYGTSSDRNHDTIARSASSGGAFHRDEGDMIIIETGTAATTWSDWTVANKLTITNTLTADTKITIAGWAHDSIDSITVKGLRHTGADAAAIKAEWAKDIWFHQKQTAFGYLYGGRDQDYLEGNAGVDRLIGGAGDDYLYGGGNDDKLNGQADNDKLYGGYGSDTLDGGVGNDELWGDAGADKFVVYNASDSNNGVDTIKDFTQGSDKIVIVGGSWDDDNVDTTGDHTIVTGYGSSGNAMTVENVNLIETDFLYTI